MYDLYGKNNTGIGNNWNNSNPLPFGNYVRQLPHYEIIKVNGEAGARSFQMAPNSSLLLADAINPNLIWLVQTDGAGYLTSTPLDVCPHQEKSQTNYQELEERITRLEGKYEQLNSGISKSAKKQRQSSTIADDESANTTN